MKYLVRLHDKRMCIPKAEFNKILIKTLIYKAFGLVIFITTAMLAMAFINKHLG